jgi:two-component system nitrate/nitrite response regulator NarL
MIANDQELKVTLDRVVRFQAQVKVHVNNLLKKLGFRSRLEAAVWAVSRGNKQSN